MGLLGSPSAGNDGLSGCRWVSSVPHRADSCRSGVSVAEGLPMGLLGFPSARLLLIHPLCSRGMADVSPFVDTCQ